MLICIKRRLKSGQLACKRCGKEYADAEPIECGTGKAATLDTPCPHLGNYTDVSTKVLGCGCASQRANGVEFTARECALHGLCVEKGTAIAEGYPLVQLCPLCPDRP
jgi:hypothetical protein